MKKAITTAAISAIVLLIILTGALFYFGVLHFNNPSSSEYPVRGVDVSSYQGDIDWNLLSSQGISFAFIKATEGSSFVDPNFKTNLENASATDLRIGAYHFFSFESPGAEQAGLFCHTVQLEKNDLPPAIDVEYYGDFKSEKDISAESVRAELRIMVDLLREQYGVKPILYVTRKSFDTIIQDGFPDCDIWYRSVLSDPPKYAEPVFWQYSSRYRLKGYKGRERYIDLNVFVGSREKFAEYGMCGEN